MNATVTADTETQWPQLPADLAAIAVTPSDRGYRLARSTYMKVGSPAVVLQPESDEQVSESIVHAAAVRAADPTASLSVRSGGHGIAGTGTNNGGVVIDVSRLNSINVDPSLAIVTAGAGATWGTMAQILGPHDLVVTSGNFGDTGVGGLATAGGLGYFARSQGLTIDRVRRVKLAIADGNVRWVDANNEPDLFWAVRGGATQVGIAVEFELEAARVGSERGDATIINQEVQYLVEDLPAFTAAWGEWIDGAPREAESFLMVQFAGDGRFVVRGKTVWANDNAAAATPTLEAALDLAQVLDTQAGMIPYPHIVPSPRSPHVGQQKIQMRDVLVDAATAEVGEAFAQSLQDPLTAVGELRALGGAVSDVASDATAWGSRSQRALVGTWIHPASMEEMDRSFAPIQAIGTGMYGAYSSDTRASAAELTWPGETGRRLRSIAESVDPSGLFNYGLTVR